MFYYNKKASADGRKTTSIVRFDGPNKMIQEARDQSSGQLVHIYDYKTFIKLIHIIVALDNNIN